MTMPATSKIWRSSKRKCDMTDNARRNAAYAAYVEKISPSSKASTSLIKAFIAGGITCVIGELIRDLLGLIPSVTDEQAAVYASIALVTVAILLTGIGVYDVIARQGGAGSFLPITGFANAMSSAAMEFRAEGLIMGTAVKMFNVVGPVVVNGIVWSSAAGILRYLFALIWGAL